MQIYPLLFVTFFPKILSGPIVRGHEMIPQLVSDRHSPVQEDLAVGITLFVFGLFKKIMIADHFATYADPVFNTLAQGGIVNIYNCWIGVFAYTFQIYFDFSGYSDMAIGLARMFGIRLPINFNSPYKATDMVEFWRRWHITLSRFLRDYIYIPLGGNRTGRIRMTVNLMITMLIGGIWHGAGWNFLWWGAWHGAGLAVTHIWRKLRPRRPLAAPPSRLSYASAWCLTFLTVSLGWILFRAENMAVATAVYRTLFGVGGVILPADWSSLSSLFAWPVSFHGSFHRTTLMHLLLVTIFTLCSPNSQELLRDYLEDKTVGVPFPALRWKPSLIWTVCVSALFLITLANITCVSEFLYARF